MSLSIAENKHAGTSYAYLDIQYLQDEVTLPTVFLTTKPKICNFKREVRARYDTLLEERQKNLGPEMPLKK